MVRVKLKVGRADHFFYSLMTEVLFLGLPRCAAILSKTLHPITNTLDTCAQYLGIILYTPALEMDKPIEIQLLNQHCFSLGWHIKA